MTDSLNGISCSRINAIVAHIHGNALDFGLLDFFKPSNYFPGVWQIHRENLQIR